MICICCVQLDTWRDNWTLDTRYPILFSSNDVTWVPRIDQPFCSGTLQVYSIGSRWKPGMSLGGDPRLGPQLQRRILAFLAGEASQEAAAGSLEKRLEAKGATTAGKLVVHAPLGEKMMEPLKTMSDLNELFFFGLSFRKIHGLKSGPIFLRGKMWLWQMRWKMLGPWRRP